MKITTAINKIEKIIEETEYEKLYIEIETKEDKYTIEKERKHEVKGFRLDNR